MATKNKKYRKKTDGYMTHPREIKNEKYEPIRTDPDTDTIQIHTDGEIPQGENSELSFTRSKRNFNKPNRYGRIPYRGRF